MTQYYHYMLAASGKRIITDKDFLEYEKYLKGLPFLNAIRIESTPWHLNEDGMGEILYRAAISNHKITAFEIKTLKEVSDEKGFILKVFKLEEIV